MSINVYMFPARDGDCFLLEINKKYIVVDSGYYETYHNSLKKKLAHISEIELLIVSHIDRDHIEGAIELFKHKEHTPKFKEIWYNSYYHLPKDITKKELTQEEIEILRGYTFPQISKAGVDETPISGVQGMSLSYYLLHNRVTWNTATNGASICIEHMHSFKLDEDIIITLLTPSLEQLSNLAIYWKNELKRKKWSFDLTDDDMFNDAMEAFLLSSERQLDVINIDISNSNKNMSIHELSKLTSLPDKSPTNASSISFILDSQGKRLLFLADAPDALVVNTLKNLPIRFFDVIKLSHHGSLKNANSLFNYIDGEFFLISTDGSKHNHPDLSTLAKIVDRPGKKKRQLVFNYPNKAYLFFNDRVMMRQYNYHVHLLADGDPIYIA